MKPPVFEYMAPRTVEETVRVLGAAETAGGAVPLAGGQSLMPLLNRRRVRPSLLVDLNRVADLDTLIVGERTVRIGALTRLRTLEAHGPLRTALPVLHDTVRLVAHPQVRSRATLGGSLCHADPAAELPTLALALGARLRLASAGGARTETADEFFAAGGTSRLPGELLTEVEFPVPEGFRFHFEEIPRHAHGGFPLVGVCVGVRRDAAGTVTHARIAAAGAADHPLRLTEAERALTGRQLGAPDGVARDVLDAATAQASPPSDLHGSGAFRTALLRTALRRAVTTLNGQETA
ncbi:FAD binding domain-containing protein [Streptomyces iconiensis]|uniref:FAD binding domain-containing protein n=1 Tax=Streptomyces iconiensis TaxID=1384038 RepID=A0ABT7A2V6_9ACTN|nr:FAD binding domain-containing protein [Streptomyces iconiensis]MDJ1134953.1 FAD binding domain-containing protein [Streptomyces iconiensis]